MVGDPFLGWVNSLWPMPHGELRYLSKTGSDGFLRNPQTFEMVLAVLQRSIVTANLLTIGRTMQVSGTKTAKI